MYNGAEVNLAKRRCSSEQHNFGTYYQFMSDADTTAPPLNKKPLADVNNKSDLPS